MDIAQIPRNFIEIRLLEFSELGRGEEGLLPESYKKRHIVAMNGLLPREQNLRITEPDRATKREGKLFLSFLSTGLKGRLGFPKYSFT